MENGGVDYVLGIRGLGERRELGGKASLESVGYMGQWRLLGLLG